MPCPMCATKKEEEEEGEGFRASISMATSTTTSIALIDTVVKASFHSAYSASSNSVSLEQLRAVIKRGVRWLDFDVLSEDAQPVVGFTTKPAGAGGAKDGASRRGDPPNEARNSLPLTTVLVEVAAAAFSPIGAPNSGDPLFVNLRIKTGDSGVYPTVAAALGNAFGSALHSSRVHPHRASLAALMGKAVFVLDTLHSAPAFAAQCDNSYAACAAVKQVRSLAGLLCGTANFPLTTANVQSGVGNSPVMPVDPAAAAARQVRAAASQRAVATAAAMGKGGGAVVNPTSRGGGVERDTSATRWRCTVPDFTAPANGDASSLIARWGVQVAPQCFWLDDDALAEYEQLFQDNGGAAFLPLSAAIGATAGGGGGGPNNGEDNKK